MASSSLTARQRQIWEFLVSVEAEKGRAPTLREIGRAFGIRSTNGVKCHLRALVARGLIGLVFKEVRSIQLLAPPEVRSLGRHLVVVGKRQLTPLEALTLARELTRAAGAMGPDSAG